MHEHAGSINVLITVFGRDRVGIVARISNELAESGINIVDINQKIVRGYFVMTLMADMAGAKIDVETLGRAMQQIGDELSLKIVVQHEDIIRAMNRI